MDLDDMAIFMANNDAGVRDLLARPGKATAMEAVLDKVHTKIQVIETDNQCNNLLWSYMRAWRKGHLWITDSVPQATASPNMLNLELGPSISFLSDKTVLLVLPSFDISYRTPLEELLKQHHDELAARPNWIIDVRKNGGGDSTVFHPLLSWLGNLPQTEYWGFLATPDNIREQKKVCEQITRRSCDDDSLVKEMQSVKTGEYAIVNAGAYKTKSTSESKKPVQIAVLSAEGCGSACEIFLMTARKSFNVKILGRRSVGSLDYADVRPHPLPSSKRVLHYAISHRMNAVEYPVDLAGVFPDIYLPKPQNKAEEDAEIVKVQRWLEGGTL